MTDPSNILEECDSAFLEVDQVKDSFIDVDESRLEPNFVYRFDADYFNNPELRTIRIISRTPKGYWLEAWNKNKRRWCSSTGKKRFAYPTIKQAWNSYQHRKSSYYIHAERRYEIAKKQAENAHNLNYLEAALKIQFSRVKRSTLDPAIEILTSMGDAT